MTYNNISVPGIGTYKDGEYSKNTSSSQYVYTLRMDRNLKARLIKSNSTTLAYMNLTEGQNTIFNSDSQAQTKWTIELNTVGDTLFNTPFWGTWYYNM